MTDNEIIKALECHKARKLKTCSKCPLLNIEGCAYKLSQYALDLINRQKAEIASLKEDNEALNDAIDSVLDIVNSNYRIGRTDGIKEFAERLKANEREHCQWCNHSNKGSRSERCDEIIDGHSRCYAFLKFESKLDNLVKEMVGTDNAE